MIKIISGSFCSRCHMIAPKLKERAEKNNYSFEEKDISQASSDEIGDSTQLPIIWFDDKQIEYDEALAMISNNNG